MENLLRMSMTIQVKAPPTPNIGSENISPVKDKSNYQDLLHTINALEAQRAGPSTFLTRVTEHDRRLLDLVKPGHKALKIEPVQINGDDLTLAEVVAVACHRAPVQISSDEEVRGRVDASVAFLKKHLDDGNIVYGINTGYGGSADTRSAEFLSMQRGLIQHHNSAVLLPSDLGLEQAELLSDLDKHHLSRSIVRGAMLTRCNSLMRGNSAVRLSVIENLASLLNQDFIPIVPLRGSISASGDLTPLSYLAGALEGNDDIYLDCRMPDGQRKTLNAAEALERAGLKPVVMMPKEGLGLMNGTAVSSAAGSLALHEIQYLALATQVLTGMCTEALRGSADNFHPFISKVRPHAGQVEAAKNIHLFLRNSRLVVGKTAETAGLYQDRYGLRTAPQWIGPQLEDLGLSIQQLSIEINSTTDNPLVDAEEGMVHHGGNFQAASVTSAMEKARLALQMLGKLMFAQCSELINPMLNSHLTPNLCFDDPGVSFTFKGVDINMAAYCSELGYLANPVSSHVQSAEMHNQAVNSLALISARYAMDAVELVSLMTAAYLYTVCQALDLHVLYLEYMDLIEQKARSAFDNAFGKFLSSDAVGSVWNETFTVLQTAHKGAKNQNTQERARTTAEATMIPLAKAILLSSSAEENSTPAIAAISPWIETLTDIISTSVRNTRTRFASADHGPPTLEYLSHGSSIVYRYVRQQLGVPLHKGLVEHPTYPDCSRDGIDIQQAEKRTIGTRIGTIYAALRSGQMCSVWVESLS